MHFQIFLFHQMNFERDMELSRTHPSNDLLQWNEVWLYVYGVCVVDVRKS